MELWTFLVAVAILELTPGPNMGYLASLAMTRGRVAGLIATAGVACGLAVHAVVAGLGAGALIQNSVLLYEVLRWIGVGYLLFLAWEGWRPATENSPEKADLSDAGALFVRGFLSNVFNPKSILFFVTVIPRFIGTDPGDRSIPFQMTVFGVLYVGVATAVHALVVTLAAQLRPWLAEGSRRLWTRRILSIALALMAVWLAWSTKR
ncbi:MAG: LysE family translocator [Pseudomonadota bacterium]